MSTDWGFTAWAFDDRYAQYRNRSNCRQKLTASEFYEYVALTDILQNLGYSEAEGRIDDEFDVFVKRWYVLWHRL